MTMVTMIVIIASIASIATMFSQSYGLLRAANNICNEWM